MINAARIAWRFHLDPAQVLAEPSPHLYAVRVAAYRIIADDETAAAAAGTGGS